MRVALKRRICCLSQHGEIVEDPERSAVRPGDEVAFLDRQVVDRHGREVELEPLPAAAVVERDPDAPLGTGVQQARTLLVLAQNTRELGRRDTVVGARPRATVVGRPPQIRTEVVELIAIGGDVRTARVEP
jgi:hypothetical protein